MFPVQTGGTGPGEKPDPAFPVNYLPVLLRVVELDGAGPGDFQPANVVKGNGVSPKTKGCAIGVELNVNVHGLILMHR